MCFKSRIFFLKLSHASIHFLLLIFGFFPPLLVQLFSICPVFSCVDFFSSYITLCISLFLNYLNILLKKLYFLLYFLCFPYSVFLHPFILRMKFLYYLQNIFNKYTLFVIYFLKILKVVFLK